LPLGIKELTLTLARDFRCPVQRLLCLRVDERAGRILPGTHTTKVLSGIMPRSLSNPTVAAQPKPAVKAKDRDPVASGMRDAAHNRAASHNYSLSERYEAGVALRGTEVKSIREGKANLKDAYGLLKDGECFLLNAHIGPFSHGNQMNHESLRTRRLLLHKSELRKLEVAARQKGFTLIPTRLYFRKGRVKCELALAKGKQEWDKRAAERKREADSEARTAIVRSQRR
jgi:SsrA-binding protein